LGDSLNTFITIYYAKSRDLIFIESFNCGILYQLLFFNI